MMSALLIGVIVIVPSTAVLRDSHSRCRLVYFCATAVKPEIRK